MNGLAAGEPRGLEFPSQATPEPAAGLTIEAPVVMATGVRGPLGAKYNSSDIFVFAGGLLKSTDGYHWQPENSKFYQGSLQLSAMSDQSLIQISSLELAFDAVRGKWVGHYMKSQFPNGPAIDPDNPISEFTVAALPGNSTELYRPYAFFSAGNQYYLTLERQLQVTEKWRGSSVSATVYESYLLRTKPNSMTEFELVSKIGSMSEYSSLLAQNQLSFDVPLYHASAPRCMARDNVIVCALRGTADDDDTLRPLDPDRIFTRNSTNEIAGSVFGGTIFPTIFSPALIPDRFYFGEYPLPPLMIARSVDGGATWTRRFLAARGGVDSFMAYDPISQRLVLASAGLTYPRKGIELFSSMNFGQSWSGAVPVTEPADFFTSGTVFLASLGRDRFVLVYDSLPRYFEFDSAKNPLSGNYRTLSRRIQF